MTRLEKSLLLRCTLLFCLQVLPASAYPSSSLLPRSLFGSSNNKTVLYTEGTFGPKGLLGSVNPDGSQSAAAKTQGDTTSPSIYYGYLTNPFYCLYHDCGWALTIFGGLGALFSGPQKSFQNDDGVNWPMVRKDGSLWAVRTFTDNTCGNYGAKPNSTLIAEYHSPDFTYQNNKPCQNFMTIGDKSGKTQVQSAAVWLDESVTNGLIFAYSSPICELDNRQTGKDNQWVWGSKPGSPYNQWMSVYNGTGALTNHGNTQGAWVCFQTPFNAFSVVAVGNATNALVNGTDMTVPDGYYNSSGQIPIASTVPADLTQTKGFFRQANLFTSDITAVAKSAS